MDKRAPFRSDTGAAEELNNQVERGQNQRENDKRGDEPEMQYHDTLSVTQSTVRANGVISS